MLATLAASVRLAGAAVTVISPRRAGGRLVVSGGAGCWARSAGVPLMRKSAARASAGQQLGCDDMQALRSGMMSERPPPGCGVGSRGPAGPVRRRVSPAGGGGGGGGGGGRRGGRQLGGSVLRRPCHVGGDDERRHARGAGRRDQYSEPRQRMADAVAILVVMTRSRVLPRSMVARMVAGVFGRGPVLHEPRGVHGARVDDGQQGAARRRRGGEEERGQEPRAAHLQEAHEGDSNTAALRLPARRAGISRAARSTISTAAKRTGRVMSFFCAQVKCTIAPPAAT